MAIVSMDILRTLPLIHGLRERVALKISHYTVYHGKDNLFMDAIKKRIFWILDNTCANCEKVKGKTDHHPICRPCPAYKELNKLGTHLDDGPRERRPKYNMCHGLTKEKYLEEKKSGISDTKLAAKYKIAQSAVSRMRKKWGLVECKTT